MKKGCWFLLSLVVIALDQASKYWAATVLVPYNPLAALPFLNWSLAFNSGISFGFLNGAGTWHLWCFGLFSLAMSVVLIVWLWRTPQQDRLQAAGLSLVLGGAIGNLLDRIMHGYVIDFIDVFYKQHHFATFNVADSAICLGAALLLIDFL